MKVGFIIRHGNTGESLSALAHGTGGQRLTGRGVLESRELAEKARHLRLTSLRSSDLPRATETTNKIAKATGLKPTLTRGLRTIDIGEVAKMSEDKAKPIIRHFLEETPQQPFPGGQSHIEWLDQVWPEVRLFLLLIQAGQHPAIVTHGRITNLICAFVATDCRGFSKDVLSKPPVQKPGSIWEVDYDGSQFHYRGPI